MVELVLRPTQPALPSIWRVMLGAVLDLGRGDIGIVPWLLDVSCFLVNRYACRNEKSAPAGNNGQAAIRRK